MKPSLSLVTALVAALISDHAEGVPAHLESGVAVKALEHEYAASGAVWAAGTACESEALVGKGAGYRGCQTKTRSGRTCQPWASQSPHSHTNTPTRFPTSGLVANYCRNPDGEPTIWCYTTDTNKRWELCNPLPPPPPPIKLRIYVADRDNKGDGGSKLFGLKASGEWERTGGENQWVEPLAIRDGPKTGQGGVLADDLYLSAPAVGGKLCTGKDMRCCLERKSADFVCGGGDRGFYLNTKNDKLLWRERERSPAYGLRYERKTRKCWDTCLHGKDIFGNCMTHCESIPDVFKRSHCNAVYRPTKRECDYADYDPRKIEFGSKENADWIKVQRFDATCTHKWESYKHYGARKWKKVYTCKWW